MSKYGYTEEINDQAETLIKREIYENQSSLVTHLLSIDYLLWDDIQHNPPDFENMDEEEVLSLALEQWGKHDMWIYSFCDDRPPVDWEWTDYDIQSFRNHLQREYETPEILEWWLVSHWLAEKLLENGEQVITDDESWWWGRTCSGQAIILDGTFQEIALSIQ